MASISVHANLFIRAQGWCWAPHFSRLLQIDLEHGESLFSSFVTGLAPSYGLVQPVYGLCPKTLSISSPTFLLPLARSHYEMNWGSGSREGGIKQGNTISPLKVGSLNYMFRGSSSGY